MLWHKFRIASGTATVATAPLKIYYLLTIAWVLLCDIEYADQVMAVHGALLAPPGSIKHTGRYLVSVHSMPLQVPRLDDLANDLLVEAFASRAVKTIFLISSALAWLGICC